MKPTLVTRKEIALALRRDVRTIYKLVDEGMPVARAGRPGVSALFDLEAVRAWHDAREQASSSSDFASARTRKELAQAIEAEQRVAIRAKTLIQIDEVDRIWSSQVTAVRAKLLAMPTALADRLLRAGVTDGAAGIETILQSAIYDTLRELASDAATAKTPKRQSRKTPTRKGTRR